MTKELSLEQSKTNGERVFKMLCGSLSHNLRDTSVKN